jgi:elongation factor G
VAPCDGAARTPDEAGPLLALAFKVSLLDERRRFVFLRLYAGRLAEGDEVWNASLGRSERVARVLLMHAAQKTRVTQAAAGQIVAVMGLKETRTGDTLSDRAHPVVLERLGAYTPVVSQAIEAGSQAERQPLLEALARVADEDPTFTAGEDPETGQLLVSGMGELHLEVVAERLRREFGLAVRLGRPQVVLRETVSAVGEAEATFEREVDDAPVWAQVAVRVAPRPRGAGLAVTVAPALAALPFARAEVLDFLQAGAREAAEAGVLEGHPLQDLEVTLLGAGWREGASRPFAYKVAAAAAVRDAAARAGPVLLEPVAALTVVTPAEHLGDVIGSVDRRGGTILDVAERGVAAREVKAEAPLRKLFGYATDLRSLTQGRAVFTLRFDRFDVAR